MILKYSDYKINQALWLQKTDSKRTNYGTTSEQFFIECYLKYLQICGIKDGELFTKIYSDILLKINSDKSFGAKSTEFNKEVLENINDLMDNLTSNL